MSESNTLGTWALVGYVAPGASSAGQDSPSTTNFVYSGAIASATSIGPNTTAANAWKANNRVALNECAINTGNWHVDITANTNGNSVRYTAQTACPQLTPSFDKIGK